MNVSEILENMVLENQEVEVDDFPGIELVEEYRNIEKPKFDWNPKDNLIACIQFSPCLPFPERLFQEFIVARQAEAFFKKEDIEKREPEVNEETTEMQGEIKEEESVINEETTEVQDEIEEEEVELPGYLQDNWIKPMEVEEQPKPTNLKRFIWSNGIYIAKKEGDYQVVVEKESSFRRIIVKCSGKSEEARNYFELLIEWFRSTIFHPDVFVICTCTFCQQRGLHDSHWIKVMDLENLKKRYEPKVQCYRSGKMVPLDEISTVKRPFYKVVIINTPADDAFCEKAREHFFPSQSPVQTIVSTRKQRLSSEFENEYLHRIRNADVAVVLISLKLTGGEDEGDRLARKMVEKAAERFSDKKCLCLFVCINAPSNGWENISPFNDTEIPVLTQTPIYDLENTQLWKQIGDDLHKRISNWLKIKADQND